MTKLKNHIRDIADFPQKGVIFRDITPLLADPCAMKYAADLFVETAKGLGVTKVVAMESRGFFFGSVIAQRLGVGFIPVRKPGKLPGDTFSQSYELEYGQNSLELHCDAVAKGERVLIHDDVLATGGTALAAARLIERAGGEVVQMSFLMELCFLHGRDKLQGYDVQSLISY